MAQVRAGGVCGTDHQVGWRDYAPRGEVRTIMAAAVRGSSFRRRFVIALAALGVATAMLFFRQSNARDRRAGPILGLALAGERPGGVARDGDNHELSMGPPVRTQGRAPWCGDYHRPRADPAWADGDDHADAVGSPLDRECDRPERKRSSDVASAMAASDELLPGESVTVRFTAPTSTASSPYHLATTANSKFHSNGTGLDLSPEADRT